MKWKLVLVLIVSSLCVGAVSAAAPVSSFTSNATSGESPLSILFTNTSTGSPTGWTWFFGDEEYDEAWVEQNASSGWSARFVDAAVALPDGSIILMGGTDGANNLNDTWRSADKGVTWQLQNASSGWLARAYHSSVAMTDGSIILMGGYSNVDKNDTWRSADKGITWQLQNASSGWKPRYYFSAVSLPNGHIILMGGYGDDYYNDTWRSIDNGVTWQLQNASSGWISREDHDSVVLPDNSIVLVGGYAEEHPHFINDTWRSTDEGATWVRQSTNPGFDGRDYPRLVAMPDGSILLMGGADTSNRNDTWRSTDKGVTWSQLPNADWAARISHDTVLLPDGSIVMMGGRSTVATYTNDTWRFNPVGSSVANPVHTYTGTIGQTFNVSFQAYNADGNNITLKSGYITIREVITPDFTATPLVGTDETVITFTGSSTGNNPDSWLWDFGDGETSTLQSPSHIYSTGGGFTVNLTVTNSTAGTSSKVRVGYITISASGGLSGWNRQDIIMNGIFTFTLILKDAATLEPIPVVTVLDHLGTSSTTSTGTDIRSYGYQSIVLYLTAEGYDGRTITYIIDRDRTETVYLTKALNGTGSVQQIHQVSYAPHLVRLRGVDYMGDPISDLTVTAIGVESSSSYDWIGSILGINLNETPLHNTSMYGTTGTDGAIVFLMVENIKYKIHFTKTLGSINETMYIYPSDINYEFIFWAETPVRSSGTIFPSFWNVTNQTDPTKMDLGITYLDTGSTTDYLDFLVFDDNQTEIYRQRSTTPNNWTVSHPVTIARGVGYAWTIYANSTRFPNPIIQTQIIRFGGSPVIPFDLDVNPEDNWNQWIALSVIFLVALLFGRASIKYASAIIPLLALFFAVIGWLSVMPLMMSLILFIGIMFYMRYAEQEN